MQKSVWKTKSGKYESIPSVWAGMGARRRRGLRILPKDQGYFVHVTSRTAGRAFLFGDEEKRVLVGMIRQWAEFSQLAVLTHCVMDNHFHVMLWVPGNVSLSHEQLKAKLAMVWPEPKVEAWEEAYQNQAPQIQASMDAAVRERLGNLPEFMRVLKQSYTCWFNRTHDRKGTLWDSRYRSVVVDQQPLSLLSVTAYIDLNPLRAGMVADPMAYPWGGYGSAVSGDSYAQKGLKALVHVAKGRKPDQLFFYQAKKVFTSGVAFWHQAVEQVQQSNAQILLPQSWHDVQAFYRLWLMSKGEDKSENRRHSAKVRQRKGMDPAQVLAEFEALGHVDLCEALTQKMRCFTQGVAVGSPGFLEELMAQYPDCFGSERRQAGKDVRAVDGAWMNLREVD
ncbi:hypothetical protein P3T73_15870 [Kiritimatiellota bacterium B12222]|nr:hypothetical protein P3T73_15870 [Kiritimatiellota bacterium B12222]